MAWYQLCCINWPCMSPSKQKWSLHLHPFYCLYIFECSTFLLPLWSCCLLFIGTGQHTSGLRHYLLWWSGYSNLCPFCWEAEMVPQLLKGYTRSQPTPPNHEDTQMGDFKVYSFNEFGSNCSFCLKNCPTRIFAKEFILSGLIKKAKEAIACM